MAVVLGLKGFYWVDGGFSTWLKVVLKGFVVVGREGDDRVIRVTLEGRRLIVLGWEAVFSRLFSVRTKACPPRSLREGFHAVSEVEVSSFYARKAVLNERKVDVASLSLRSAPSSSFSRSQRSFRS